MTLNSTDKDLVFIASGGRTGTTFLGRNLGRVISDCWSEHEPDILHGARFITWKQLADFGLWHMVIGRLLGQSGVRVLGHRLIVGDIDDATVRQRIRESRRRYHDRIRERLVVESHAQWWYLAEVLPEIWPGAKLIGVIRDPRSWIRSWLNHGGRYDSRDRVKLFPPGRLTPDQLGQDRLAEDWNNWGAFEKLAWEWSILYGRLSDAVEVNSSARMWRFEDLFSDDPSAMTELVSFAAEHGARNYAIGDLRDFTKHKANASRGSARDWQDWTPAQAKVVRRLCGPTMERWGYGNEPEWKALLESA